MLGILLILTACVSNKTFKTQQDQVQIMQARQNSQDALLEMARKDVNDNRRQIDDIIIRMKGVDQQMQSMNSMQTEIGKANSNILVIQGQLAALNEDLDAAVAANIELNQKLADLNTDTNDTFDAYADYISKIKGASAEFVTKEDLQKLTDESTDLSDTLNDLATQVDFISQYLNDQEELNTEEANARQEEIDGIKDRLYTSEQELASIQEDLTGLDDSVYANVSDLQSANIGIKEDIAAVKTEIADLKDADSNASVDMISIKTRLDNVNNDLTTLTTDLSQVIAKEKAAAEKRRQEEMKKKYQAALAEYTKGNYEQSILLFEDYMKAYPDSPLMANACYWVAEDYYSAANYPKALREFENVVARFPDTEKAWDAQFKVGLTYLMMQDNQAAYNELMTIKNQKPDYYQIKLVDKYLKKIKL
jgi:TolA-binding protein